MDEPVEIDLLDISGKHIRSILSENQTPGEYKIDFNAAGCPAGIYFLEVSCGSLSHVQKIVKL